MTFVLHRRLRTLYHHTRETSVTAVPLYWYLLCVDTQVRHPEDHDSIISIKISITGLCFGASTFEGVPLIA